MRLPTHDSAYLEIIAQPAMRSMSSAEAISVSQRLAWREAVKVAVPLLASSPSWPASAAPLRNADTSNAPFGPSL